MRKVKRGGALQSLSSHINCYIIWSNLYFFLIFQIFFLKEYLLELNGSILMHHCIRTSKRPKHEKNRKC